MKNRIHLSIIMFLTLFTSIAQNKCAKLDIVVCVDYSGSTDASFYEIRDAVHHIVNQVSEDISVGLVYFAENAYVASNITNDRDYLLKKSREYYILGNKTSIYNGLEESFRIIKERRDKRIIILISDGDPHAAYSLHYANIELATNIKDEGIDIYTLYINTKYSEPMAKYSMQKMSTNGFFIQIEGYEMLMSGVKSLIFCL